MVILISHKVGFKKKYCQKRQWRSLYNDRGVDEPGIYDNYKHICTKYQNSKIYEENISRIEGRHGQLYNDRRRLQDSHLVMNRTTTQKINEEIQDLNNPTEQWYLTNIQSTPPPNKKNTHFSLVHLEHSPGSTVW